MEVVVTTGAISRAKLQSNDHHQQNNNQSFLQAGCPSCRPTNSAKALKGKYHIPWTCLSQAHLGVFQLCLWPLIAPGNLGGGFPCLSSAIWCQYPSMSHDCFLYSLSKSTLISSQLFSYPSEFWQRHKQKIAASLSKAINLTVLDEAVHCTITSRLNNWSCSVYFPYCHHKSTSWPKPTPPSTPTTARRP